METKPDLNYLYVRCKLLLDNSIFIALHLHFGTFDADDDDDKFICPW